MSRRRGLEYANCITVLPKELFWEWHETVFDGEHWGVGGYPFYYHYSQVDSDPEWLYLLVSTYG